jgi:hypothetical protein
MKAVPIVTRAWQASAGLLFTLLSGCSGNGVGLDANGNPLPSGQSSAQSGPVQLSADFNAIQANVFTPICSVCHIGASAPQGLMLDAAHSYSLLVGVPSTEVPSVLRVDPGNPNASYLIQKLEGHAAVGAQMPLDESPLPASTIAYIVQWITDGAQPPAAAQMMASARPFEVDALAPLEAARLDSSPARIAISFTRELDVTRVSDQSVWLQQQDSPAHIASALTVPLSNPRTLLLQPRAPLPPGRYMVVTSAEPGSDLASLDGATLSAPGGAIAAMPDSPDALAREQVLLHFQVGAP